MAVYLVALLWLSGYCRGIYGTDSTGREIGGAQIRVQFWHGSNSFATQVDRSGRVTVRQAPPDPEFPA